MSRSRSSFDLTGAIATATSLSIAPPEELPAARYRRMPLVSFGGEDAPAKRAAEERTPSIAAAPLVEVGGSARQAGLRPQTPVEAPPVPEPPSPDDAPAAPHAEAEAGPADTARKPPKLPDLSDIKSPLLRCQKIIEWIVEAVGAADVFIADAAGLPLAGAVSDAEARLGATGVVASAVAHLASALPGNSSSLFEMHVGEGPFFQLIGFEAGTQSYVVGFHRPTPLGFRQAHAVRLACRHALLPGLDGAHAPPSGELDPVTHRRAAAEAGLALAKGAT